MEAEAREGWGEGDGSFAGEVGVGVGRVMRRLGRKKKERQMEKAKEVE